MRDMKDSGVEWIGEIPNSWNISKLKYLGQYINGFAFKPEDWGDTGKPIIRIQDLTKSSDNTNYFDGVIPDKYLVTDGDILVSWAATLDAFIWTKGEGWLNQHIFKAVPNNAIISPDYFFWLIKLTMQHMNNDNKHGIMMQHVTLNLFNNFAVPLPAMHEQSIIASLLQAKYDQVDALITNVQAQIDKLNDYRVSVISSFTNDTNFQHLKLKRAINNVEQGWSPSPAEPKDDGGWQVLTLAAVKFGRFNFENTKPFEGNIERCKPLSINVGDFLLTRSNTKELVGQVCIVNHPVQNTIFSDLIYRLDLNTKYVNPEFMLYYFQSTQMRQQIQRDAHGSSSTMVKITHKDIDNWEIDLPDMDKQIKIAEQLNDITRKIDDLISIKRKKIDKLEQYKRSLIYEYVTGKREVV